MASSHRPGVRSRPARAVRRHGLARFLGIGVICGLGYLGFTTGAFGPAEGLAETLPASPAITLASINYSGDDPVITGSVGHLFQSAGFTGPNRAEKTDRKRPVVDALAFSRSFSEVRQRIAALRGEEIDPALPGQSRFAATGDVEEGPRMSLAALNPATAAALDAIAGIAPPAAAPLSPPLPIMASEQLAYARANAPATGGFASGESRKVSDKDMWCLAMAIYFEARGESYRGQVAVAQVVLNRVNDHRYPDTICGVVYQNQSRRNACQFSFACDGIPEVINDQKSWAQAQDIAQRYMNGSLYLTEVGDATHYHATYVSPAWAPRMTRVTQIGLHVFYKFKRGWLFG